MMETIRWRADAKSAPSAERARRRLRRLPMRIGDGGRRTRRRRAILSLVVAAAIGVVALSLRRAEPPEPGALRRVAGVSLNDTSGRVHAPADWRGSRAVVLFFLGTECPISNGY